jgi:hypothetical protein
MVWRIPFDSPAKFYFTGFEASQDAGSDIFLDLDLQGRVRWFLVVDSAGYKINSVYFEVDSLELDKETAIEVFKGDSRFLYPVHILVLGNGDRARVTITPLENKAIELNSKITLPYNKVMKINVFGANDLGAYCDTKISEVTVDLEGGIISVTWDSD